MSGHKIDPVWEAFYKAGNFARAPYAEICSFSYRYSPRDKTRKDVRILEVGCGGGNNLSFLAAEGFSVYGLDGSASAIEYARDRFAVDKLAGHFQHGDFTDLPYEDGFFDLVVDRNALTCAGTSSIRQALDEIRRVLTPAGKFYFNPVADSDSRYFAGEPGPDGLTVNIDYGELDDIGQLRFFSRRDIDDFFDPELWSFLRIERVEIVDMLNPGGRISSSWRVEAQKK